MIGSVLEVDALERLPRLPYDDPAFARLFLDLHLDESTDQASRRAATTRRQLEWLLAKLPPVRSVFHPLCGPGLVAGCLPDTVTRYHGVDINAANTRHARLVTAMRRGFTFAQQDVRDARAPGEGFDLTLFTYEAINAFPEQELRSILGACLSGSRSGDFMYAEIRPPDFSPWHVFSADAARVEAALVTEGYVTSADGRVFGTCLRFIAEELSPEQRARRYYSLLWLHDIERLEVLLAEAGYAIQQVDTTFRIGTDVDECAGNWHVIARKVA